MTTRIVIGFFLIALVRTGGQTVAPVPPPLSTARIMVGLEQTGAGSAAPVQKATIGLFFSEPLSARVATWGDVRLSSIPVNVQSTLVTLPSDVGKIAAALAVNQLVRSGEFLVGASYQVAGGKNGWSALSLIASVGAAMPLTPPSDRFYRQYYGGVRVQSSQCTHLVDVSLGQNEAITGGRLQGTVLRADGFYSLPVTAGNFIYLFGTAMVRATPGNPTLGNGRDSYRVGVGVDIFQMLKALRYN